MIRLLIKTHNNTGMKYLCKTEREDWVKYTGSGILWKKHLKKYGNNLSTELLFETEDKELFRTISTQKSIELDVINSNGWANLVNEEGTGGNTVGNKRWITNGNKECFFNGELPEGWKYGRSDTCRFKNPKFQKEMSNRVNLEKRGKAIKEVWSSGKFKRDHSKCGTKGNKNPSKRPEIKQKIRESALLQSGERSERMKKNKVWLKSGRWKKS